MTNSTHISGDVIIIGGGIMGCATALFLCRQYRRRVILLERDVCGARASGINFGGVRRQGRPIAQLPLAERAHQLWGRLHSLIGTEGEYERSGHFKMAFSHAHMQALADYAERSKAHGLNLQLIEGPASVTRHLPAVGRRIIGGSLCPEDGQANPRLIAPAFGYAARRAGADVREHTTVQDVEHDGQRFIVHTVPTPRPIPAAAAPLRASAPVLVNCAGAWGGPFAAQWGEAVPMHTIPPAMGVTEPLPFFLRWSLGVEGGSIYLRQVRRGNIVFGGGRGQLFADGPANGPAGEDATGTPGQALWHARTTQSALLAQMARLAQLMPPLAHAQLIRTWSGNEGTLPDEQPILGPSLRRPGLYHAFGFSGAGFQLGPGVGEILAELIIQGRTSTPLDAFAIDRFHDNRA